MSFVLESLWSVDVGVLCCDWTDNSLCSTMQNTRNIWISLQIILVAVTSTSSNHL